MESPAVAERPKIIRRTYLVDRAFQLKYTLILVVVGMALALLFGAMMYQAHVEVTEIMDLPDPYREAMTSGDKRLFYMVAAIAAAMGTMLGLFGVLVTHRVAGPIYVLARYMSVIAQGRYPAVRPLRKNDELKDLFQTFNSAVASLKERDCSEAEALTGALKSMEALASRNPEAAKELRGAIDSVRRISARKREATEVLPQAQPQASAAGTSNLTPAAG